MTAHQEDFTIHGVGTVTPPPGMTIEEMDQLVREAEERRKAQED